MTTDKMPKPDTGVHRRPRSTSWQWRIKAPQELRSLYSSEWAHRCSLGTADLREANRKAAQLRAQWLTRFEEQRRELKPQQVERITPELGQMLAQRVAHALLSTDEKLRTDPAAAQLLFKTLHLVVPRGDALRLTADPLPLPEVYTATLDPLEGLPVELARELAEVNEAVNVDAALQQATQRIAAVLPLAQAEGRKLGLAFDRTTPGALEALRECLKAYRSARAGIVERDRGEVVETPAAPTQQQAKQVKPVLLRDVFKLWNASKVRGDDAVKACERALKLYEEHTGNPPVQQLTRMQGDGFRAHLLTLGSSSKTAHDRLTWVKSLLGYACRDLELIQRQPWEGIDIEHRTEKKRTPWTAAQLKAFFGLPLFTRYDIPRNRFKAGADAAYWLPLLGLFTGARLGELCQLRAADVLIDDDGQAFIKISDEGEGATVKTDASRRTVPLHSELVRLGFLDYARHIRSAGHEQLWPLLKFRDGKPSGYFSDWFREARQLSPVEVPDFHSLRHTVRSVMAEAGFEESVQDRITGHEVRGSTGTRVYSHPRAILRKAVESIQYPGLELPRVYKPGA